MTDYKSFTNGQYDELLAIAETGNAEAQFYLAKLNPHDPDSDEYYDEAAKYDHAIEWYTLAAKQGLVDAQYSLGLLFAEGVEGHSDYDEGCVDLQDDDDLNDPVWHEGVGHYMQGERRPDYGQSFYWYSHAAEQGHAESQYRLGRIYESGLGIAQDDEDAVRWYTAAAKQDHIDAQCHLGRMYETGQGVVQSEVEAASWYMAAAKQNDSHAQCQLGLMYEAGLGVAQNQEEAVRWYTAAAEQNDSDALCHLGRMYEAGLGVVQNNEEAVRLYTAAGDGSVAAKYHLGRMYETGRGVAQSEEDAFRLYEEAVNHCWLDPYEDAQRRLVELAETGNAAAQYHLALVVQKEEAIHWLTAAAEQGRIDARYRLETMAREGSAPAQYHLGRIYESGLGTAQDDEKAVRWFTAAAKQEHVDARCFLVKMAEAGDATAQNNLGEMYGIGREGGVATKDHEEAIHWFTAAAEQGHPAAQNNLGNMYELGWGGAADDHEKAIRWFTAAAEQGNTDAQESLHRIVLNKGTVNEHTVAAERGGADAQRFLTAIATAGNVQAQFNLGVMYESGQGVAQSDELAIYWYKKAAKQGHAKADRALVEILGTG